MEGLRRPRRGIRGLRLLWALCSCGVLLAIVVPAAFPAGAKTTRVSVSSAGVQGNERSSRPSISADGRFVAFESWASDLVADDTNRFGDVFVHDRSTGKTTRVSLSAAGAQANGDSSNPSISADGRFVAFESWAPNLAAGDTNHNTDVFVHNRKTGKTTRVSVSSAVAQAGGSDASISANGRVVAFESGGDVFVHDRITDRTERVSVSSAGRQARSGRSSKPSISADGRFVAFASWAPNLVAGDTNGDTDVFVRDRMRNKTRRVSLSSARAQGNRGSSEPSISADGRLVAFASFATNLVRGDTRHREDVFVRDRRVGKTSRISVSSAGAEARGNSLNPSISADGRFVGFESFASNLVRRDTDHWGDVFVRDRRMGKTTRVSVSTATTRGNAPSSRPSISAGGRRVAFASEATNLVDGDTNDATDVFVRGPLR